MKPLKIQITLRVLSVATLKTYGFDKKFAEKIEPGDLIMIESDWKSCFTPGSIGKKHEVIITNKGLSKTFTSHQYIQYLFRRITDFEQLDIL